MVSLYSRGLTIWMVTDRQVRLMRKCLVDGKPLKAAALGADMDERTVRKYRDLGKLPSELEVWPRTWRTRKDPFADVWGIQETCIAASSSRARRWLELCSSADHRAEVVAFG
jgi:hypothetical protein